ncbi:prepilin peptidase dependent protein C [Providencia alcalifaciens]|nr:prepilin peptidase dependent protein C [Providencia alcalifaciens]
MKQQDNKQQGFALIESMVAMVVFAILLIALLNYSQYITLNFNWIFRQSAVIRELQSHLEKKASMMEIESENSAFFYPDMQINLQTFTVSENCTNTQIALSTAKQTLSLSRWFCRTGDNNVSSLSF